MNQLLWTVSMFVLGIGIYAWTIASHEPIMVKIVCAEAGSFVLFCGVMSILHSVADSRH